MTISRHQELRSIPHEPSHQQVGIVSEQVVQVMIHALGKGFLSNDGHNRPPRIQEWAAILQTNASHPKLAVATGKLRDYFESYTSLYLPGQLKPTLNSAELNHESDTFSHEILSALVIGMYSTVHPEIKSFNDLPSHQQEIQNRYNRALEALYRNAPAGTQKSRFFENITTGKLVSQLLLKPDLLLG